jgi:hypothetical protein
MTVGELIEKLIKDVTREDEGVRICEIDASYY